jgi:hypothetical protein
MTDGVYFGALERDTVMRKGWRCADRVDGRLRELDRTSVQKFGKWDSLWELKLGVGVRALSMMQTIKSDIRQGCDIGKLSSLPHFSAFRALRWSPIDGTLRE